MCSNAPSRQPHTSCYTTPHHTTPHPRLCCTTRTLPPHHHTHTHTPLSCTLRPSSSLTGSIASACEDYKERAAGACESREETHGKGSRLGTQAQQHAHQPTDQTTQHRRLTVLKLVRMRTSPFEVASIAACVCAFGWACGRTSTTPLSPQPKRMRAQQS